MTRYLVTGASGLLGINFSLQAYDQGSDVIGTVNHHNLDRAPFKTIQMDFSQMGSIEALLDQTQPDVIVHTAALAVIDACEKQPELSLKVNAELPGQLASAAFQRKLQFIHISTDAVFDGVQGAYAEDGLPNPLSTYARHKLLAEKAVLSANPDAAVARVNFFGWSLTRTRSLSEWFYKNLSEGRQVNGFTDIYFCPLLVNDLVDILMKMADKRLRGVYHVLASASLSKYEFGVLIARQFGFDEGLIKPISWKDGGLQAVRSPNLTLKVEKLINDLGEVPPTPLNGIRRMYELWQNGYADRIQKMAVPGE